MTMPIIDKFEMIEVENNQCAFNVMSVPDRDSRLSLNRKRTSCHRPGQPINGSNPAQLQLLNDDSAKLAKQVNLLSAEVPRYSVNRA